MILVDFSHMLYRYTFANLQSVQENPNILAHLLVNGVINIANMFKASKDNPIVIALDGRRKDSWRKEYFEENFWKFEEYQETQGYKGHRKPNEEVPWDEIFDVVENVTNMLNKHTDYNVIGHKQAEADDIIYVGTKYSNEKTTIVSSDKDFRQLVSEKVKLYDPIKKVHIKEDNPKDYLTKHILTGDAVDNIKGCKKRLGPKTAEKMLKNIEAHLEIDDELRERYEFNKVLIDLTELPKNIHDEIYSSYQDMDYNFNANAVLSFCRKYKLRELGKNIDKLSLK